MAVPLTILKAHESLPEYTPRLGYRQRRPLLPVLPFDFAPFAVLHNHKQLALLGVINNFFHPDDIWVMDLFEDGDFASDPG